MKTCFISFNFNYLEVKQKGLRLSINQNNYICIYHHMIKNKKKRLTKGLEFEP